jgi:hypothetical protein
MAPPPSNVLAVPRWLIIIHAVQFLFAIVVLGLDAYGIKYIPYNALIFSLVVVSTYSASEYVLYLRTRC